MTTQSDRSDHMSILPMSLEVLKRILVHFPDIRYAEIAKRFPYIQREHDIAERIIEAFVADVSSVSFRSDVECPYKSFSRLSDGTGISNVAIALFCANLQTILVKRFGNEKEKLERLLEIPSALFQQLLLKQLLLVVDGNRPPISPFRIFKEGGVAVFSEKKFFDLLSKPDHYLWKERVANLATAFGGMNLKNTPSGTIYLSSPGNQTWVDSWRPGQEVPLPHLCALMKLGWADSSLICLVKDAWGIVQGVEIRQISDERDKDYPFAIRVNDVNFYKPEWVSVSSRMAYFSPDVS